MKTSERAAYRGLQIMELLLKIKRGRKVARMDPKTLNLKKTYKGKTKM
jgi:hypothetical protein